MRTTMLFCALLLSLQLFARQVSVSGSVVDNTGEPLPGASVVLKGSNMGVVTDIDGNFITKVETGQSLVASFIGFMSREAAVTEDNQVIHFVLEPASNSLDEVVAIGYGTLKKKLVTGATVQVKGDDISKLNTISAVGALSSAAPGLNILSNSGKPGAGYKVSIRGLGTTGDAAPIVVIDGLVGSISNLNDLNPNDIESIDVLKDAASTAIYGARAANGVILVTTKRGKDGRVNISFDGYYGWQNVARKPQMLGARDYMTIMNEAQLNDGLRPFDFASILGREKYEMIQNGQWDGTNWVDEVIGEDAPQQNWSFGVNGGNSMGNYSIGLGYTSQEGIIGRKIFKSKYERYTARINSEWSLIKGSNFDILSMGETLQLNMSKQNGMGVDTEGPWWNGLRMAMVAFPIMSLYDEEGEYSKCLMSWSKNRANPVAWMYNLMSPNRQSTNYSARGNFNIQIQPIKDLRFRSVFGYGYWGYTSRSFAKEYNLGGDFQRTNNSTSQDAGSGYSWSWENTLSYKFDIKEKNHFDVLIGMSAEKWGYGEGVGASRQKTTFGDWKHAYISNTEAQEALSTWSMWGAPNDPGSIASYFGRATYDFDNKYMATFILRADGSSNFDPGHRWGYFPSASVGWNVTNEKFMEPVTKWMDYLKIRASWGRNGNCAIDNFQYLSTIAIGGSNYFFGSDKGGVTIGSNPDLLANSDITWEKSEQLDLGLDARFFNSRLGLAFDWYRKTTRDWLVQAPILLSYGAGAPYVNGGDVRNQGVELALSWNDRVGRDFSYGASVNFGYNKNEVTKLNNGEGVINGYDHALSSQTGFISRVEVGYPIGFFYGYSTAGVFQTPEQVRAYVGKNGKPIMPNAVPGDVIFVDRNGDGVISADDRGMIGDPNPDFTLGINLNAQWKGFDLSVTGFGAFGQQIAHSYRDFGDQPKDNFTMDIASARWHGQGTSNRYPRITATPHMNWTYISDIYVDDADYFRISNITFGYDFKTLSSRIPLNQLRVYVACNNLHTFTKYKGMDPEVGYGNGEGWASGIDIGNYPCTRTFMVGVSIKY